MVVCKCRKATKLYCFVHKVPVCGECICFPEHQICVIRTYSEWVIDGEYDWPTKCCCCQANFEEGIDSQTTRLGCLHITHTNCLVSHLKSFPSHTAPAGYVCPACSTPIWPPKSVKDSGSSFHSKLKEAIMQTGLEKNIFGNHPVSLPSVDTHSPPPAFASDPLIHLIDAGTSAANVDPNIAGGYMDIDGAGPSKFSVSEIVEIDGPSSAGNFIKSSSPVGVKNIFFSLTCIILNITICKLTCSSYLLFFSILGCGEIQPGATTRKAGVYVDRQNSETSYYVDDEDGNRKKYSRRGPFHHKFLRALLPFWSSSLPTLPVTAPPRKDAANVDDVPEGRPRHQKSSRMDPRKILLFVAIMACMATMGILYYRLAQRALGGLGDELPLPDDEPQ